MTRQQIITTTKVLRYVLLFAIGVGALRTIFYVTDPHTSMGGLVAMLVTPFLVCLFLIAKVPWETKAKHVGIPFAIFILLDLNAIIFLAGSVQTLLAG